MNTPTSSDKDSPGKGMISILEDRVIKRFSDPRAYKIERDIYARQPDFAPRLLHDNGADTLTLERVDGRPLIEHPRPDFPMAARLLAQLHNLRHCGKLVQAMNDTNPRNFLQGDNRGWIIDFSDATLHFPEPDLIHFLLFWAANQPHEKFKQTCESFVGAYVESSPLDSRRWTALAPSVAARFDLRRQMFGKQEQNPSSDVLRNRGFIQQVVGSSFLT